MRAKLQTRDLSPDASMPISVTGINPSSRRASGLSQLAELVHALATTEAVAPLLPQLLDHLVRVQGCEAAAVVQVEPGRADLTLLASYVAGRGRDVGRGIVLPRAGTLLDRALAEKTVLAIAEGSAAAFDPLVQPLLGSGRAAGGYVLPLRAAGIECGGLIVLNPREPFSSEELALLIALGDLAAVAIDRAKLRQSRADDAVRASVLNAVLRATMAGYDEETLIRRGVDALLAAYPAERAELMSREGEALRLRYAHRARAVDPEAEGRVVLHQRAAGGEMVVQKEGELVLVCVPVRARDRLLGSLLLARPAVAYRAWEGELLCAVGEHLGAAIELSRHSRRIAAEGEQLERLAADRSAMLKEAQAQLERYQWLASLGELAAGVAHDLNNALNPVVAFAELIKEHCQYPEKVRMYAERILMAAQGGAETVRRIQRFTRRRLGTLPFEPILAAELVQEAVELTRPTWSQRHPGAVVVEDSIEPELMLLGNVGELRQALFNLVGNALDAMPGGGTLRFVARGDGEQVVLGVQDTGSGMPQAVLDRVLEPFFTTKGAHGTGLGLAEVFGIARRHGGDLAVESWEGVGTTVLLRLPRARATQEPVRLRRTGAARRLYHILLVDDSLLTLEAHAATLRAAGHTVATAANAQTALRIFNAGHFDLVLSDLGLPDMSGWELVDRLRQRDVGVRVGVITGWAIPDEDEALKQRGIDLVFVKPVDPDQLLAALS
jgi:signal transduction histidine kinase